MWNFNSKRFDDIVSSHCRRYCWHQEESTMISHSSWGVDHDAINHSEQAQDTDHILTNQLWQGEQSQFKSQPKNFNYHNSLQNCWSFDVVSPAPGCATILPSRKYRMCWICTSHWPPSCIRVVKCLWSWWTGPDTSNEVQWKFLPDHVSCFTMRHGTGTIDFILVEIHRRDRGTAKPKTPTNWTEKNKFWKYTMYIPEFEVDTTQCNWNCKAKKILKHTNPTKQEYEQEEGKEEEE